MKPPICCNIDMNIKSSHWNSTTWRGIYVFQCEVCRNVDFFKIDKDKFEKATIK